MYNSRMRLENFTHVRTMKKHKVILCLHPTGHYSVLAAEPNPKVQPGLLFTNRPK